MGRRILAIVAAAVIALIGAVLVLLYAKGRGQPSGRGRSPTTVYVSLGADPGRHVGEGGRAPQAAHRDPDRLPRPSRPAP